MSLRAGEPQSVTLTDDFVTISGVTRDFVTRKGVVHALGGVDLDVKRGTFISLLGPSGCGKSTLLALLAGLDTPTSGSVAFDGQKLTGPNTDAGVVFQKDLLLEWRTAKKNIELQFEMRGEKRPDAGERAMALLESVGIGQFAESYPRQLSGGMRQRVGICRALVHDPPLLLLDEPFGALDAITREQLNVDLSRMVESTDKTVFLVTHSIEEAVFLGDRVIVMSPRPGRVVADIPVLVPRPRRSWPRGGSEFDEVISEVRTCLEKRGILNAKQ